MLVIQINGGLGNQLFTYARGYSLARDTGENLILDKYIYETGYKWPFVLDKFNVTYRKSFIAFTPCNNSLLIKLYKVYSRMKRMLFYTVIQEKENYTYCPVKICKNKNYYISGYWQSHRYFDKYRNDLKIEFSPQNIRDRIIDFGMNLKNACAIHVRRGDYASYKGGKILDLGYYWKAISQIRQLFPDVTLCIFSDDITYCKDIFKNIDNIIYASSPDTTNIEELYLMTQCKHFIIANSSFSWWGAYLGEKEDSVVIGPVTDQWKEDFYMQNWIKINTEIE